MLCSLAEKSVLERDLLWALVGKTDLYFAGIAAVETAPSKAEEVSASKFDDCGILASESEASDFGLFGFLISFLTSSLVM